MTKTFFSKIFSVTSVTLLTLLSLSVEVKSQEADSKPPTCPNNPSDLSSVDGFCVLTPEEYGVKIYEMGICTSNPIVNNKLSKETCYTSLVNSSPAFTNVVAGNSLILKSDTQRKEKRPKALDYTHAYIVISPEFKLKFTYKLNNINYYSNGVNSSAFSPKPNATTIPPAKSFIETLNDFGDPEEGFSPSAAAQVTGGTITALLTDSNLERSTSAASTSRLVGVFVPTNPISISDDTKGLEVKFVVTDQGGGVESCAGGGFDEEEERFGPPEGIDQVCQFGSGPFSALFTPY